MAFSVNGSRPEDIVDFYVQLKDGDIELYANGTLIAYIDGLLGKLYLTHLTNTETKRLPGLAFDARGRLAIAE
jgi:hypothetical protein